MNRPLMPLEPWAKPKDISKAVETYLPSSCPDDIKRQVKELMDYDKRMHPKKELRYL